MSSSKGRTFRRGASLLGCGVLLATLSGCLITSNNRVDESGVAISSETLREIEPGTTSEAWLVSVLGEPTSRTPTGPDGATEILRYDHTRSEKSRGTVLFLFGGSGEKRRITRSYFEVNSGVVHRYWTEPAR